MTIRSKFKNHCIIRQSIIIGTFPMILGAIDIQKEHFRLTFNQFILIFNS